MNEALWMSMSGSRWAGPSYISTTPLANTTTVLMTTTGASRRSHVSGAPRSRYAGLWV